METRVIDLEKRFRSIEARLAILRGPRRKPPALREPLPILDEHQQIIQFLTQDAAKYGLKDLQFRVTPPDYYDWSLEERGAFLGCPVEALCKSLIVAVKAMKDEKSPPSYMLVVNQYMTTYSGPKLERALKVSLRQAVRLHFAAEEEAFRLSGFEFNAITPVGMRTRLPVAMSDRLCALSHFWLGGGRPDLKMRVATKEFIEAFRPHVADLVKDATDEPSRAESSFEGATTEDSND